MLWKNAKALQEEIVKLVSGSKSDTSLIILQTPLEKLRQIYQSIAYVPLKSHNPISAFQISFEYSIFLRKLFCVYESKLGIESRGFVLEELKSNLSYCLVLSEFRLDDEGTPGSSARIFECAKYSQEDWLEKSKPVEYLSFEYEVAYVDGGKREFEEGVTVHKQLLEKWIVQIDALLMLNDLEKSSAIKDQIYDKEELHNTIVLAYLALNRFEEAVDYARFFPSCVKYLCHSLVTVYCQQDERLVVHLESHRRKFFDKVFSQILILLTQTSDEDNSAKLSVLESYLCLHHESNLQEFQIDDRLHELLLDSCGLEYAKRLAEFDFIDVSTNPHRSNLKKSIEVVLQSVERYKTRVDDAITGSAKGLKYFDPLLLKKVRFTPLC